MIAMPRPRTARGCEEDSPQHLVHARLQNRSITDILASETEPVLGSALGFRIGCAADGSMRLGPLDPGVSWKLGSGTVRTASSSLEGARIVG